jgi:hypothetical protein
VCATYGVLNDEIEGVEVCDFLSMINSGSGS